MRKYSQLIQPIFMAIVGIVFIFSSPNVGAITELTNNLELINNSNDISIQDILNKVILVVYILSGLYLIIRAYSIMKKSSNTIQSSKYFLLILLKVTLIVLIVTLVISIMKWILGCLC